jgi:hypothetical protein
MKSSQWKVPSIWKRGFKDWQIGMVVTYPSQLNFVSKNWIQLCTGTGKEDTSCLTVCLVLIPARKSQQIYQVWKKSINIELYVGICTVNLHGEQFVSRYNT